MTPPSSPAIHHSILQVAIPTPLRTLFDYLPPSKTDSAIQIGARVRVPFGKRSLVGIVMAFAEKSDVPANKLKRATALLDSTPCLPPDLFDTLIWAANYYQHPIGEVIHTALPVKLRQGAALADERRSWRTTLSASPEDTVKALDRAHRQQEVLQFLLQKGEASTEDIKQQGFDTALLRKLEASGLIEQVTLTVEPPALFSSEPNADQQRLILNDDQANALEQINGQEDFACILLNGVTGSGKTEVYMRAMERYLRDGKQCLLLVPEIGLTPQTVARFESRFSCSIVTLHSNLTDRERLTAWRLANSGQAGIIIGTRSAVFTPMARPGLIIVDEEHDSSFKQQDGFRYSARDISIKRAQSDNIPIILGSATPSLESLNNSNNNKYLNLNLSERAGSAEKSPMTVLDVSESSLDHGFSEQLLFKIEQHLAARNQVLVFINRRGYAPVLQCKQCAWVAECRNCIAQLTVHNQPTALRCHHCERVETVPRACPNCQSTELHTLGVGTQKLEQYLQQRFQSETIIRIDRDSTRNKKTWQQLIDKINSGAPAILLGTQMLAKGHHFPHVTLVAILDADIGLFSADFRGQEHMAQTIVQVAGRAGRSDKLGEVIIQSRHASHPALAKLTQLPYTDFAQTLLQERQTAAMPPYSHLGLLRIESRQVSKAIDLAKEIAGIAQSLAGESIELLGPVPAPMEKKAGKYRLQILSKSQSRGALQQFLGLLCGTLDQRKLSSGARWSLDVDPVDLI